MDETLSRTATAWLAQAPAGSAMAFGQAYATAYAELKRLARGQLRRHGRWAETTVLVNEAYLKLRAGSGVAPEGQSHLMGLAACAMRQVLVGMARQACAGKRAGVQVTLDSQQVGQLEAGVEVLALDAGLERLAQTDPRAAQMVELRYFGGYSEVETAAILGITDRTLRRDWRRARAFLQAELDGK